MLTRMNRTLTLTGITAATLLALTACSSSGSTPSSDQASTTVNVTASSQATAGAPMMLTATQVMAKLTAAVPTAKQTIVYTAASDPNSLLGRPGEYIGAVRFTDSRVPASDTQFLKAGDVDFGGGIETFNTVADAQTRAAYVEKVTAAMGAIVAEYDFQHGHVLIRVSHFLTPDQAAAYKAFVNTLP